MRRVDFRKALVIIVVLALLALVAGFLTFSSTNLGS